MDLDETLTKFKENQSREMFSIIFSYYYYEQTTRTLIQCYFSSDPLFKIYLPLFNAIETKELIFPCILNCFYILVRGSLPLIEIICNSLSYLANLMILSISSI